MILVSYIVFLGAALAIILGTGQIIRPQNGNRNLIAASLLYCLGLIHFITFIQQNDYLSQYPLLSNIQIPLFTLLGPLCYFYFMRILNPPFTATKRHFIHFIPTVMTFIILSPYFSLSIEERQTIQLNYLSGKSTLWETFPNNLVVLIFISTLVYILLPLKTIVPLFQNKLLLGSPSILTALGFILCFSLTILCVIFYQFYDITILKEGVVVFYTCWIIAMYLVNQKYPCFLTTVTDNISNAKYQKSQLSNINTNKILDRLNDLFHNEKIFLDEELALPALAEKLSITTHQLSEILNHTLNTSFKDYLKKHRIKEAKRLLLEDPSQTILTIAMDVGFRSVSTFNSSFKKETGISPIEYRKKSLSPS